MGAYAECNLFFLIAGVIIFTITCIIAKIVETVEIKKTRKKRTAKINQLKKAYQRAQSIIDYANFVALATNSEMKERGN